MIRTSESSPVMSQFLLWSSIYDAAVPIARSYFLKTDGTLWGVGDNIDSTIGNGSTDELIASPQQILSDVVEIGNGMDGFFAILKDGTLWRWAHHDPDDSTKVFKIPVQVSGIANAKSVARIAGVSGGAITLVLTEGGKVYGFGIHNEFGSIGDGTMQRRGAPVLFKNFENIFQVDAGFYHSAAIK